MGKKVLLVDDDPEIVSMLDAILSHEGYQVIGCTSPSEAVDQAVQQRPAVAIVDLLMSGDGVSIIQQLKREPATAHIPVIVCTAALAELRRHCQDLRGLGCSILTKPFEIDDLLGLLAHLTEHRKAS